eukprot:Amastigsp_a339868_139.p6 type:complete len:112 gc:universal Amastigsp_a339868_139:456-121(-)
MLNHFAPASSASFFFFFFSTYGATTCCSSRAMFVLDFVRRSSFMRASSSASTCPAMSGTSSNPGSSDISENFLRLAANFSSRSESVSSTLVALAHSASLGAKAKRNGAPWP